MHYYELNNTIYSFTSKYAMDYHAVFADYTDFGFKYWVVDGCNGWSNKQIKVIKSGD